VARTVTLFAGPSAHGVPRPRLLGDRVRMRPPVQRGDIDRLVRTREPGVIVVCDGVFQARPAVSHAELCSALDAGWDVWGVSSIGAIRAHELRDEGMRGFGYVHRLFDRVPDLADDEMCLLHAPQPPYFPLTEALVNLRFALDRQRAALAISARSERTLIESLRALWFGDRTEACIRALMLGPAGFAPAAADHLLGWLRGHRVKTLDLVELMSRRPWERAGRR
jgi:hypothetical protein